MIFPLRLDIEQLIGEVETRFIILIFDVVIMNVLLLQG
jgi:hypothetical protein